MGSRPDEVLPTVPDEEPAPKIDHSAAAAAAQDLVSVSPAINQAFFLPVSKKNQGQKNSNLRSKKNWRAILNKKLSVLESTWDFH